MHYFRYIAAAACLSVLSLANADSAILHEYVDPSLIARYNPDQYAAGSFGGSQQGGAGLSHAPDVQRPVTPQTPVYHDTPPARYTPDRDTRAPSDVQYEDPFSPHVTPYKRMFAYDRVNEDFTLGVEDSSLCEVSDDLCNSRRTRRNSVSFNTQHFYASMPLSVGDAHTPIAIPSPMGGATIINAKIVPTLGFSLLHDSADNLFVRVDGKGDARLVVEFFVPNESFATNDTEWPWHPTFSLAPSSVSQVVNTILPQIGVDRATLDGQSIAHLVKYFREFTDSDLPIQYSGNTFVDLVRSKKGVCRHRAYAFTIVALALGFPTRFVSNEAHAWVELWDGHFWVRIDLGGAASRLHAQFEDPQEPTFRPPTDAFPWPSGATPGSTLSVPVNAPQSPTSPPVSTDNDPSSDVATNHLPASKIQFTMTGAGQSIARGSSFAAQGDVVDSQGKPCQNLAMMIAFDDSGHRTVLAERLVTDEKGHFYGELSVPSSLHVGDYSVVAFTEGDAFCGPGVADSL